MRCVDGGSRDGSREIASYHGATVLDNAARDKEEAHALGLEAASGELGKARRRARRSLRGEPSQRRGFQVPRRKLAARAAWSLSIIGPAATAIRATVPVRTSPGRSCSLHLITILAYLHETVRAKIAGAIRSGRPLDSSSFRP